MELTCKKSYDIIVCGGGVAGVAAALTARKNGKSVLLLEKSIILGGLGTLGLVNYFDAMCDGVGHQVVYGMAEEWLRESSLYGWDDMAAEWKERKNGEPSQPVKKRLVAHYSPYIFALQLTEKCLDAGVELLYDCMATLPVMDGNTCKGVITESKSGREYYEAKMIIDTTGDADLLRRSGMPTVLGQNTYIYETDTVTLEGMEKALEAGDVSKAFGHANGGSASFKGLRHPEGVPMWSGTTVEDVTEYMLMNQMELLGKLKQDDRNAREVIRIPFMPQFRTTCRMDGDYTLTEEDCFRHREDSICACNDFSRRGPLYEVPFGCIVRKDFPNLLTAGRSASGDGQGWHVLRVIPVAILTGQAAGNAASLAIDASCGAAEVDIKKLQSLQERDGVLLHFPDEWIVPGATSRGLPKKN